MIRPTYAEVNLSRICENINQLHTVMKQSVKMMAIVKADAYGHGLVPVAKEITAHGVDWLGVAIPEEAELLRKEGITVPILVLSSIPPCFADEVVNLDIQHTVYSGDVIEALEISGKKRHKAIYVHIKLDTGMGRIGIYNNKDLIQLLKYLKKCNYVKIEGVFTHFAVSDSRDKSYTNEQNMLFKEMVDLVYQYGFSPKYIHAANSAAILDCPDTHYNMVRAGIGIYGYFPSVDVQHNIHLQPALSWKTHISHIKRVYPGDYISYGRTYQASKEGIVATLPVGYADGYRRALGNEGSVMIKGKRVPVIGRVCMDQCMIDISDVSEVSLGDEVDLLGEQLGESITADDIADWCHTISYEILTSISKRVPRIYSFLPHQGD